MHAALHSHFCVEDVNHKNLIPNVRVDLRCTMVHVHCKVQTEAPKLHFAKMSPEMLFYGISDVWPSGPHILANQRNDEIKSIQNNDEMSS